MKTLAFARDYVKAKVSRKYWLTIKLCADDTYAVEVAQVRMSNYIVIEQEFNVYAEDLPEVVRRLGDRE